LGGLEEVSRGRKSLNSKKATPFCSGKPRGGAQITKWGEKPILGVHRERTIERLRGKKINRTTLLSEERGVSDEVPEFH